MIKAMQGTVVRLDQKEQEVQEFIRQNSNKKLPEITSTQINKKVIRLTQILKQRVQNRRNSEDVFLIDQINKFQFFKQLKEQANDQYDFIIQQLAKRIQVKNYRAGKIIFSPKNKAENFYIILNGQISIWKKLLENDFKNQISSQKLLSKYEKQINEDLEYQLGRPFDCQTIEQLNKIYNGQGKPKFDCVREIEDGQLFGDIDILNSAEYHSQIALVTQDCTVGVIKQKYYHQYISKYCKIILHKQVMTLETIFQRLTMNQMYSIHNQLKQRDLKIGQYLYKQNDKFRAMYIVIKGEIQIVKDIKREKNDHNYGGQVCMSTVSENTILGDEDCIHRTHTYSAVVKSSQCSVYFLDKNVMNRIKFMNKPQYDSIIKVGKQKRQMYDQRMDTLLNPNQELNVERQNLKLTPFVVNELPQIKGEKFSFDKGSVFCNLKQFTQKNKHINDIKSEQFVHPKVKNQSFDIYSEEEQAKLHNLSRYRIIKLYGLPRETPEQQSEHLEHSMDESSVKVYNTLQRFFKKSQYNKNDLLFHKDRTIHNFQDYAQKSFYFKQTHQSHT